MTNEQKAKEWFKEWEHSGFNSYSKDALLSFAAFCLDKREEETGFKDANGVPIMFGDTIESFDSEGNSVRHTIERDIQTGLPLARYGKWVASSLRQNWINEFKKVIVKP